MFECAGWAPSECRPVEAIYDAGDMIGRAEDRIDRIDENPGAAGLTNRLIEEMDEGLGGVEKGTYNIIAGRPGMGKTSCASSLAIGFSIAGHMGVYFNAEMTAEQQAIRLSAALAPAMGMPIKHRTLQKGAPDNQQR